MSSELVRAVASSGEVRPRWCDSCNSSAGFECDVFAILSSGVQRIAAYHSCDRCGTESLACHFCGDVIATGAALHRHLRYEHAEG